MDVERCNTMTRRPVGAGLGALAFGLMTFVAMVITNSPGGDYSASQALGYVSRGERATELLAFFLAVCAIPGLVAALAHMRDALAESPQHRRAASLVWGVGLAAAACFAVGWAIDGGQIFAHWEGGSSIAIAPGVTYLIGEIGAVVILGCGAMLLGFALIVLVLSSRGLMPDWLRRLTLVFGLCGVAGLAWATFFVLLLGTSLIGAWLVVAGRREPSREMAVEAGV